MTEVTIVHAGGGRKTYPAKVTRSFLFVFPPMHEPVAFDLRTGKARPKNMALWRVSDEDMERLKLGLPSPEPQPRPRTKRRAKYLT